MPRVSGSLRSLLQIVQHLSMAGGRWGRASGFAVALRCLCTLFGWEFSLLADPLAQSGQLLEIVGYPGEKSARIVLRFSSPVEFRVQAASGLNSRQSQVIWLPGTRYAGRETTSFKGLVESLETIASPLGLALRLTVSEPAVVNAFFLSDPFRVVVDVAPEAATRSLSQSSVSRVALDAGHGGEDPGALSEAGLAEKDVALDIVLRAAPLLARELGVTTLLTRNSDVRVALEERVAKANAFGADLFLSVHCNADKARKAHGYMSFVLDGSDSRLVPVPRVAEVEKTGRGAWYLGQLDRSDRWGLALRQSRRFASLVQRATSATLHRDYPDARDGGVHGAGFYVLAGASMPAVLFEASFISHPVEAGRLAQARYRQKLADGIVNAVRAFQAGL